MTNHQFPNFRVTSRILVTLILFSGVSLADSLIQPTAVDWSRGASVWLKLDGAPTDIYFAGVVMIQLSENGKLYNRDTMCVDLFTDIYIGQTYNTQIVNPADVPGRNLAAVAWLIDNALLPTQSGNTYTSLFPQSDWVTTSAQGAGLQVALWDITTDGQASMTKGRVQASTTPGQVTDPAVLYWTNKYESLLGAARINQAYVYINTSIGSGSPAQMLEGPQFLDGGPTPPPESANHVPANNFMQTPEPATCILAGLALIGLGLFRRHHNVRQGCPVTIDRIAAKPHMTDKY